MLKKCLHGLRNLPPPLALTWPSWPFIKPSWPQKSAPSCRGLHGPWCGLHGLMQFMASIGFGLLEKGG